MIDAMPTLTPEGFTTNKAIMMIKLYEYFLSSEYSQSNTFYGDIASLKYILSEAKDATELNDMVTAALTKMYNTYYMTTTVYTVVKETDNNMTVTVNVVCRDYDQKVYKLNETLGVTSNKVIQYPKFQEKYNG